MRYDAEEDTTLDEAFGTARAVAFCIFGAIISIALAVAWWLQ